MNKIGKKTKFVFVCVCYDDDDDMVILNKYLRKSDKNGPEKKPTGLTNNEPQQEIVLCKYTTF